MRARYVNPSELLTPIGRWVAARLPHVDRHSGIWGKADGRVFRIYGGAPLYRRAIFDFTSATFFAGHRWTRVTIFGATVFERNAAFSGRPKK